MKLAFLGAKTKVMGLNGRLVPPFTVKMERKISKEVT